MSMYLVFLFVSAILFSLIVWYSIHQKNRSNDQQKKDYVDPLFEELEEQKKEDSISKQAVSNQPLLKEKPDQPIVSADSIVSPSESEKLNVNRLQSDSTPNDEVSIETKVDVVESKESSDNKSAVQESAVVTKIEPQLHAVKKNQNNQNPFIVDLVARVKNEKAIEQQELLVILRKHDYKFSRKIHLYGLNELTDLWRDVEHELPSARFLELGISIQLADRDGCMTKKEMHDFQQMVLEYADRYDARIEFSMDLDEALNQATKLDEIGRRFGSMAVLNVVPKSKSGFRLADIESCARDLRMNSDNQGVFIKTKGQKQALSVLYRLACTDGSGQFGITSGSMTAVHDLVVYMNVPATEEPVAVFQEMVSDANNLATWLDGKVVDRNGKAMTQRSYSLLMSQISDIALKMQREGLQPGDAVSKKIF